MVSESQDGTDQRNRRRTKRKEFKTTVRTLPNSRGEKERERESGRGRKREGNEGEEGEGRKGQKP